MAIVAQLTPTPIPATTQNGAVSGAVWSHVTVAPAGGAGTYTFLHNLQWTPTFAWIIPRGADGVSPTLSAAWCFADTSSTLIGLNVSGNGTYDVVYM